MIRYLGIFLVVLLLLPSCEKDGDTSNPFDDQQENQDTVSLEIIDPEPNSIAGIYQNVFRPTCANVGCHDGTFEPDFRTMEGSYNTLVYQTPIKNNGQYTYRVKPGSASESIIVARLQDVISPSMPIQIDPGSDWLEKGDQYIADIISWIDNGALDINGNSRELKSPKPNLVGAGIEINGLWMDRASTQSPIKVPSGAGEATFYFAFEHNDMDPADFTYNKVAFSSDHDNFPDSIRMDMQVLSTPKMARGFEGIPIPYTHTITLDLSAELNANIAQWYFRVYVQDLKNPVTEIPNDKGIYFIKNYMSFVW